MKQAILRRGLALLLAAAALGTVLAGAGADSAAALWQSVSRRPNVSRGLLRWELGDLLGLDGLSAATVLALDPAVLGDRQFVACPQQGPQVLIVHSHASESYTMPPGQEYVPSGTFRTADRSCNMVRVGDELAAELSSYGISVVHDRTLHDGESYNDAYENSLASIQSYLAKYPSIVYVLDLHRDAVQDANGTQYKLVTAEDPAAAQVSLIMGVAHDGWQDNLRLAIAVQEKLESQSPTLMRPITLLNYRYNQFAAPGSLLVEVGAAGNSLDEALRAARLFAKGFAETILGR